MSVVDDYYRNISPGERDALERVRRMALEMVPTAEEVISYGMPAFRYHGKIVLGFLANARWLSLYPDREQSLHRPNASS